MILKKKELSFKLQASSGRIPKGSGFFKTKKDLTMDHGCCRMNLERNIMDNKVYGMTDVIHEIKRLADALEEILRLVKKDMEPREKSKK